MPFVLVLILAGSVSMQRFESEAACVAAKKAVTIEAFSGGHGGPVSALCVPVDTPKADK